MTLDLELVLVVVVVVVVIIVPWQIDQCIQLLDLLRQTHRYEEDSPIPSFVKGSTKADAEHRPSVWRTLSKTTRSVATGDQYTSKPSLGRAHSIESPDHLVVLIPLYQKSRLSTIGASPPPEDETDNGTTRSSKKKRRSSLSDLKSLMAQATLGPMTPSPEQKPVTTPPNKTDLPPRTPSPAKVPPSPLKITKVPINGSMMDRDRSLMYRNSPNLKENTPITSPDRSIGNLTERAQNIMSSLDSTPISSPVKEQWRAGHHKTVSLSSNIPTLRGTPRDPSRPAAGYGNNPNGNKSPQRLRLQKASLQNELSKIGEEMAKLNAVSAIPRTSDIARLSEAVLLLETKIPTIVKDLNERNDAVKKDLETSLQASEFKVKGLDQLYKESSAENELFAKEELVTRMRESSEETARVKKENARLRREVLTLRTLLKGQEGALYFDKGVWTHGWLGLHGKVEMNGLVGVIGVSGVMIGRLDDRMDEWMDQWTSH
ncbi:hypothetical protein EYC84_000623 [Monilinia fructicola]|uniref:Uncharacterized protein n=1 Tax=Monilinia fructicola TaxID=38448 RepID=A0A5M9JU25_MONFR|nr:hypothetical protein EYC84_000623 [Monilinia fructicola]